MCFSSLFFFFNDTATTEIYTYCHTLALLDARPISRARNGRKPRQHAAHVLQAGSNRACSGAEVLPRTPARRTEGLASIAGQEGCHGRRTRPDRKSTRLNSSH